MGNANLGEKLLPACRQTGKIHNLQFLNLSGTGLKFAFCIHACRQTGRFSHIKQMAKL
jgi:hypothetical protein